MDFKLSDLKKTLLDVFGFDGLRPLQEPIVQSVMDGNDLLAILKTSGGKSLCYQLPAVYKGGTTLVISPLISLMKDQVDSLIAKGVPCSFVNSSLSNEEVSDRYFNLAKGKYRLFYVSPERFKDEGFLQALRFSPLHTVAIDEAHCASQWGHDFRPSYSKLGQNIDDLEASLGKQLQRIAFTATATARVQDDITNMLRLRNPDRHLQDFDRENLSYGVVLCKKQDREENIIQSLEEHPNDCTIIYCVTVKAVERIYNRLKSDGFPVDRYHGRLASDEKNRVQEDFLSGRTRILVSTSAFGMGVDKSDVRVVIHAQMPGSLEAWYQEAGRAGRDGEPSKAILFYHESDKSIHSFFINAASPPAAIVAPVKEIIFRQLRNGPAYLNPKQIAMMCTRQFAVINSVLPENGLPVTQITNNHIKATINLLKNQGELEEFDGMLNIANWSNESDYTWVEDVKKHNWLKFNSMCSWCETNLCRRWQILRYFDERKTLFRCGNCDNCQSEALSILRHRTVEKAVRPSTLMNLARSLNSIHADSPGQWLPLLLGTLPVSTLSDNQIKVSGMFAYHAVGDVKRWRELLIECGLLTENNQLTENGNQWLDGTLDVKIGYQQTTKPLPLIDATSAEQAVENLRSIKAWRKATAYKNDISPIEVLTEAQMRKISAINNLTLETLKASGFSQKWIDRFGCELSSFINKHSQKKGSRNYEL